MRPCQAKGLPEDELFIRRLCRVDPSYRLPIRVINELAWQNLFAHQLFRRPVAAELADHNPEFTIIAVPGFQSQPSVDGTNSEAVIMLDFEQRLVVIGGTSYAGEIKKAVFTVMNYSSFAWCLPALLANVAEPVT